MLDEGRSNYLCAVYVDAVENAVCFADLSTGEVSVSFFSGADVGHLLNDIAAYSPAEAVLNAGAYENVEVTRLLGDKLGTLVSPGGAAV